MVSEPGPTVRCGPSFLFILHPRHQPGRMWARLGGGSGKPFLRWGCGWTQPAITRALSWPSTFPAVSSLSPPQRLSRGCLLLSPLDKREEEAQCGRVTFPRLHSPDLAEHIHWSPRFILGGGGQGAARDAVAHRVPDQSAGWPGSCCLGLLSPPHHLTAAFSGEGKRAPNPCSLRPHANAMPGMFFLPRPDLSTFLTSLLPASARPPTDFHEKASWIDSPRLIDSSQGTMSYIEFFFL